MRGGVVLVVFTTLASPVYAQAPPPSGAQVTVSKGAGEEALARAQAAWDRGEFDAAEPLYRQAIELGGLPPDGVLDAYVRLGAARAVLGKSEQALLAFKAAALINKDFTVPPEAGRRAVQLADRARRAATQVGTIDLHADVPRSAAAGESVQIEATLDGAHAAVASKIAISARDPMTGKSYEQTGDSATSVHFRLPASLALPNATIVVRVDALDHHNNRLASVEGRVHVAGATPADALPPVAVATPAAGESNKTHPEEKHETKKHGFWSSPWPYVIGGAALAAGGAAVYLATRPGDDVNVGAVRVNVGP
jgi:hypothetical protein